MWINFPYISMHLNYLSPNLHAGAVSSLRVSCSFTWKEHCTLKCWCWLNSWPLTPFCVFPSSEQPFRNRVLVAGSVCFSFFFQKKHAFIAFKKWLRVCLGKCDQISIPNATCLFYLVTLLLEKSTNLCL